MKNFNLSISLISILLIRSHAYAQADLAPPSSAAGAPIATESPTVAATPAGLNSAKLEVKADPIETAKPEAKPADKVAEPPPETDPKETKKQASDNDSCSEKTDCDDILAENERDACFEKTSLANSKRLGELYKVFKQKMQRQLSEDNKKLKQSSNSRMILDNVKADKETQTRLITAQNAWVQFRDANCYLISAESLGGSGEGQQYTSCINTMTKRRIDELQKISERIFSQ